MLSAIILFQLEHPVITGIMIGGAAIGAPLGIIGWCLGHDYAMRKVDAWVRRPRDEAHGDVPNLPPCRDRRPIATTPGRWV